MAKETRKQKRKRAVVETAKLKVGAYVVHPIHGTARFADITQIEGRDYLALEFEGGAKSYVPMSQIGLLQPYKGKGKPKLGKMEERWEKTKKTGEFPIMEEMPVLPPMEKRPAKLPKKKAKPEKKVKAPPARVSNVAFVPLRLPAPRRTRGLVAERHRFTCPICGMMAEVERLDGEPPMFEIYLQTFGGRRPAPPGKRPRQKYAPGIMDYTPITDSEPGMAKELTEKINARARRFMEGTQ